MSGNSIFIIFLKEYFMNPLRKIGAIACLIAIISFSLTGCATILHGSTDNVSLSAKPDGTKVYIDGVMMGTAPLAINLKSNKDYVVEFKKPGYETKTVRLNSTVGAGWIVVDVLFGLVPVIIDAATGSWNSLDQTQLDVELEKQQ